MCALFSIRRVGSVVKSYTRTYSRSRAPRPIRVFREDGKQTSDETTNWAMGHENRVRQKSRSGRELGTVQKPMLDPEFQPYQQMRNQKTKTHAQNNFDFDDSVEFEYLKEGDKRFGRLIMTAKSRAEREKKGKILLEGRRLITDAIEAGAKLDSLYFSKLEYLNGIPYRESGASLYKVNYNHLKLWSDVTTCPGIMAVCNMPRPGDLQYEGDPLPFTLILDNIRDPGNMGTIIRSAVAAGCSQILAMKGCVDIWEPKVLRAGAGSHFRARILNNLGWHIIGSYLSDGANLYLADCKTNAPPTKLKPAPKHVADAVAEAENEVYIEKDEETGESVTVDESYLDENAVALYQEYPVDTSLYSDVAVQAHKETVLVIGGETEGLSAAAHKLAVDRGGEKLYIPMSGGVESLNAALAGSIILFDFKRKLTESEKGHR